MNREEKLIDDLYLFCTEEKYTTGREILSNIKRIVEKHNNEIIAEMEELKVDETLTLSSTKEVNKKILACQRLVK